MNVTPISANLLMFGISTALEFQYEGISPVPTSSARIIIMFGLEDLMSALLLTWHRLFFDAQEVIMSSSTALIRLMMHAKYIKITAVGEKATLSFLMLIWMLCSVARVTVPVYLWNERCLKCDVLIQFSSWLVDGRFSFLPLYGLFQQPPLRD